MMKKETQRSEEIHSISHNHLVESLVHKSIQSDSREYISSVCSNSISLKEKKKITKSLNCGETNQDMKFMEIDAL